MELLESLVSQLPDPYCNDLVTQVRHLHNEICFSAFCFQ